MTMKVHSNPPASADLPQEDSRSAAPCQDGRDIARESQAFDDLLQRRKKYESRPHQEQRDEPTEEHDRSLDTPQKSRTAKEPKFHQPPSLGSKPASERDARGHDSQVGQQQNREEAPSQAHCLQAESDMHAMLRCRMPLKKEQEKTALRNSDGSTKTGNKSSEKGRQAGKNSKTAHATQVNGQGQSSPASGRSGKQTDTDGISHTGSEHKETVFARNKNHGRDEKQDNALIRDSAQQVLSAMQSSQPEASPAYAASTVHSRQEAAAATLDQTARNLADKVHIQVSDPEFSSQNNVRISFKQLPDLERLGLADGQIQIFTQEGKCKVAMIFPHESPQAHELLQSLKTHLQRSMPDVEVKIEFNPKARHADAEQQQQGRSRGQRDLYSEMDEQ